MAAPALGTGDSIILIYTTLLANNIVSKESETKSPHRVGGGVGA